MKLAITLSVLCIVLFAGSLVTGRAPISIPQSLGALFSDTGTPISVVMREIRLPRALLAVMIGASLGLSGAAMQGYLRNPLHKKAPSPCCGEGLRPPPHLCIG